MSGYTQLKNSQELTPISEEQCNFFQYERYEGAPSLIYAHDYDNARDLMGHEVKYFANGVLLVLKDDVKDYKESLSFVFINNKNEEVLRVHNRNAIKDPITNRHLRYEHPLFNLEIKVFNDYVYVAKTYFKTNEKEEYIVDIITKEKKSLTDLIDGEQLSI